MDAEEFDVAIVGGGPAGSTLGSLLRKYHSGLRVGIFERESFPRDHVGESQLPPIGKILEEMECWDRVEEAGFPIKIGATYRWGSSPELWDFEFLPLSQFRDEERPARFVGQRQQTAFQVDRARYDQILLDQARSFGCEVWEECAVTPVLGGEDEIDFLLRPDGRQIRARYYVDASGGAAVLRRALGVPVEVPTALKNVAFWSYWQNADWAVEIGVGGTRVQVMSIGTGWIWFIPLSPTRTSVGFVCPAQHYKAAGQSPESLYLNALEQDPRIRDLMKNAVRESDVEGTKDWSFLADRAAGKNWFLAGESIGFADPILAAGMTLAQTGARELAYILPELLQDEADAGWLKDWYGETQRKRIRQHIRFADFWYSSNGQFTDLQAYTSEIARDAGLSLNPDKAFQWLGTGGFTNDTVGQAGIGGLDLAGLKQVTQKFTRGGLDWKLNRYNSFKVNLRNAKKARTPVFHEGEISSQLSYQRGTKCLVATGMYALMLELVKTKKTAGAIYQAMIEYFRSRPDLGASPELLMQHGLQALEVMLIEGWVQGLNKPGLPRLKLQTPEEGEIIHAHIEGA